MSDIPSEWLGHGVHVLVVVLIFVGNLLHRNFVAAKPIFSVSVHLCFIAFTSCPKSRLAEETVS